jgi:transcriptional antiterminator RfaH
MDDVEVFLPRIRFRRKTRQGVVWVTEALFPNYVFARFDWKASLRRVHHAPGVSGVIHFGDRWPTIPDAVVDDLRQIFGDEELHVLPSEPGVGEPVQIVGGVFHGLRAVVTQLLPARNRINVLLEFVGRQTTVELPLNQVVREGNERSRLGWRRGSGNSDSGLHPGI